MHKLERSITMFNDNIDEEFKIDNDQVMSPDEYRIVTDPATGVEYIVTAGSELTAPTGSAICVRVDRDGKPIINPTWKKYHLS